ncbi:Putative cell wall binding repeat 2 [Acididesulfobacillus acetoxydans]|uniref:Cell wall binding repeat 2 n=1 Tax=Acididesulfobacillus acetoxydans TaxID=1561005 RepID=A0A8S0XA93_9FIRM|nr:cell wall-binding repeat-containing protein [Acididesulfobacillus acetoxydans]CAA7599596.1 Putative cell wall binding repeat 2 [Acididesulfobacillus acetoxydans]CEJ07791.1 Cell wall-binding protein [Acididesulfobacillus acetoxydans]
MKKRLSLVLILSMLFLLVVGATAAQAAPWRGYNRFYGQDRFQTSIAIARQLYPGQVQNVVLASAYSFPDALAASTLAAKLKAPIILIGPRLHDSLVSAEYVKNHLVAGGTVTIVGGVGVVPQRVEQWMLNRGFSVTRLGGSDRFATDADIVKQLNVPQGTPLVVANGYDFPDALGISSVAASKGWPILLTGVNRIPQTALDVIKSDAPTNIYVVGGEGVVSDSVYAQIQAAAPSAQMERFGGVDRFETLSLILNRFFPNPSQIYVANGFDFADALSGSTLAAANNAPILLINPRSYHLPAGVHDYLVTLRNNGVQPQVNVLGGDGAVPRRLVERVNDILQNGSVPTPPATGSETLTVSNPSTTGFTVSLSPALNGLASANFTLSDSSGNPIAITGAATSDNGATYTLSAALTAGQTYSLTASDTGYTFGSAQYVTVSAAAVSVATSVYGPSTTGFTLDLSPAVPGLTANNFTLSDGSGNPVAITGAATANNGAAYQISAALTAGQTYVVTTSAEGYTFGGAQYVTVPAATVTESLTVSNPSATGFTVSLSPALNGLTSANFTLADSSGNPVAISGATTADNGAAYTISAALTAGQTYTLSASAPGCTFGTAQTVVIPQS